MENVDVNFAVTVKNGLDQLKQPIEYEYRELLLDLLKKAEAQLRSVFGWRISFSVESESQMVGEAHSIFCTRSMLWGTIKFSRRLGSLRIRSKELRQSTSPIVCDIGFFVDDSLSLVSFSDPEHFPGTMAKFFEQPEVSKKLVGLFGKFR